MVRPAWWQRVAGTCARRSGTAIVALAEGRDEPQVLEEAAAAVFVMLATPMTVDDVVVEIAHDHGLAPPAVRGHVEESLALLLDADLIEAVHGWPG